MNTREELIKYYKEFWRMSVSVDELKKLIPHINKKNRNNIIHICINKN